MKRRARTPRNKPAPLGGALKRFEALEGKKKKPPQKKKNPKRHKAERKRDKSRGGLSEQRENRREPAIPSMKAAAQPTSSTPEKKKKRRKNRGGFQRKKVTVVTITSQSEGEGKANTCQCREMEPKKKRLQEVGRLLKKLPPKLQEKPGQLLKENGVDLIGRKKDRLKDKMEGTSRKGKKAEKKPRGGEGFDIEGEIPFVSLGHKYEVRI